MERTSSSSNNNGLLIFLVTLILVGLAFVIWKLWFEPKPQPQPQPTGCTLEVKVCPDGSTVSRTGPACEFAPCPEKQVPQTQEPSPSPY